MWLYDQKTGRLVRNGKTVATGYSGFGKGKNDPAYEEKRSVGPIPRGIWLIGDCVDSETHGPKCLELIPGPTTDTHGRSGFLIHGDSVKAPGEASKGCIVLPRWAREVIINSGDSKLLVI